MDGLYNFKVQESNLQRIFAANGSFSRHACERYYCSAEETRGFEVAQNSILNSLKR